MNEHGLSLFHLEKKDFNLKLKKGMDLGELRTALGSIQAPAPEEPVDRGRAITSPMVGTFYRKPTPDSEDFVSVGDTVSEGQTLCIIEAMKVMNEIKAEASGIIVEISVEDASPVQYGDVLFLLK